MRRLDWKTYSREREGFIRTRADEVGVRPIRRRPRDPGKRELLLRLDEATWRRWIETGKLEVVEKRRYRLHIGP